MRRFTARGISRVCYQFSLLCLALFLTPSAGPAEADAAKFKNVVIVSIDALHPSALTAQHSPITYGLLKQPGAILSEGVSTSPPKTLIAHAAMVTGKGPGNGGRTSNEWQSGQPGVQGRTLFHDAKVKGYRTGFFYSKSKLGYLVSDAVDTAEYSPEYAIEKGQQFIETGDMNFTFIHVSGLDIVGPLHGWLSPEYLEELSYIDQYLEPLYERIIQRRSYLLIVISDHGGYGKSHGGTHPEEAKLLFGIVSDSASLPTEKDGIYKAVDLPFFLSEAMR